MSRSRLHRKRLAGAALAAVAAAVVGISAAGSGSAARPDASRGGMGSTGSGYGAPSANVFGPGIGPGAAGPGVATKILVTRVRTAGGESAQAVLVHDLALARLATARYVTNLGLAKAHGYGIITRMIPNMGWHYMNPKVTGFNVRKPPILVYEKHGGAWQLGALEWVFTSKPAKAPIPGAKYGAFGAGCHYEDGTFAPADSQSACPTTSPQTGAAFNFWHPNLVTLHVWLWYPNPSGLFASTNPLVAPFNEG